MTPPSQQASPADPLRPAWTQRLGGSWKNSDVPWQGWHCADVLPAGPDEVCEMCRQKHGRRIHRAYVMRHPDQAAGWRCGINCAWRMERGEQKADQARGAGVEREYEKDIERRLAAGFTIQEGEDWKLRGVRVRLPDGSYTWDLLFHMDELWRRQGRAATRAAALSLAQAIDPEALRERFLHERAGRAALAAAQKQFALENRLYEGWLKEGIVLASGEDEGPWQLRAVWNAESGHWQVSYQWAGHQLHLRIPISWLSRRHLPSDDEVWSKVDFFKAQIPDARKRIAADAEQSRLAAEARKETLMGEVAQPDRWGKSARGVRYFPLFEDGVIYASQPPWNPNRWTLATKLPGEEKARPLSGGADTFEELIRANAGYLRRKVEAAAQAASHAS